MPEIEDQDATATEHEAEAQEAETVDYAAEAEKWKELARKQEKRAKENAAKARRFDEIEAASKSEAERANDRIKQLESELSKERAAALRSRIQARYGIQDDDADLFLTGDDEDTLTKQAERLAERAADRHKKGNHVPDEGRDPGKGAASSGDTFAEFAESFFTH